MKGIPTHIIIRNENIPDLDRMYLEGKSDDDIALLRIEFTKFLLASFSTFLGPKTLTTEEINNSYFLRLIVDKIFNQASRAIRIEDFEIPEIVGLQKLFLFEIFLKQYPAKSFEDAVPKFKLDKLPNDWKKISNSRKNSFVVGGPNPDFSSWNGLGLHRLPVSSFVLVDPYFLERWIDAERNLKSILNGLIDPKLGGKKFELIIAVRNDPREPVPEKQIKENQLKLEKLLKTEFPKFTFAITLIYVNKKYTHDRYLFTDFYYLKTGGGFNFYRTDGRFDRHKSNDLDIYMLSNEDVFKSYKKRLQAVVDWIKSPDSFYGAAGNLQCRLFQILD